MRHKVSGRKLHRKTSHRLAMYRNIATDLLKYEKVVTTDAKAKEVRGFAEKIITLGKEGSLHSRRQALTILTDKKVADKVFSELKTRYAERQGGYTRISKLGLRLGDGALIVKLELVQ